MLFTTAELKILNSALKRAIQYCKLYGLVSENMLYIQFQAQLQELVSVVEDEEKFLTNL